MRLVCVQCPGPEYALSRLRHVHRCPSVSGGGSAFEAIYSYVAKNQAGGRL